MRALILLALLGTALAMPRSGTRIVGGSATTVDQYPFVVNMQIGLFGNAWWLHECGGSLLSPTMLLSDASCYRRDDPERWRALLGTSSMSGGGTIHPVARILVHPSFDDPFLIDNSISIIYLAVPAVFSNTVRPARIPAADYVVPDGAVVTAVGWGMTSGGGDYSEQLRHVDVNIINQELCAERFAYLKELIGFSYIPDISDGMLCAGILDVGGKGACTGDHGGPLVYMGDVVVGVYVYSHFCADPEYPGVNMRVSHYSDWIIANA